MQEDKTISKQHAFCHKMIQNIKSVGVIPERCRENAGRSTEDTVSKYVLVRL